LITPLGRVCIDADIAKALLDPVFGFFAELGRFILSFDYVYFDLVVIISFKLS
jgi:hypothetical protein